VTAARRYYTDVPDPVTPPRPCEVVSATERDAWDAAHSDEHVIHRCVSGRMHDGPCRCHCGRTFEFGSVGL
jgi:hypothetical protein